MRRLLILLILPQPQMSQSFLNLSLSHKLLKRQLTIRLLQYQKSFSYPFPPIFSTFCSSFHLPFIGGFRKEIADSLDNENDN